ncbi:hypothetical protein EES43_28640 [Streptomyces sp. ADI96-02]|uniref:ATP-binding protein n=1 Tax=unclassified Streptomyces TaxID=2593676 RepID=UPI000F9B639E|nr:ATP-binding protein [Streptomyces sp. ADI96-02]RPK54544.1 hypothetical protein EES43_28640 [Streptomyces sp. ADI96-02]
MTSENGVAPGEDPEHTAHAADPLRFPAARRVPATAGEARDQVKALLSTQFCDLRGEDLDDVVVADALLVTSELVTNAIRHAGGLTAFDAVLVDDALLVEVADASHRLPAAAGPMDTAVLRMGGLGWSMICRLARHVAVIPGPEGKRITALVPLY